MPKTPTQPLSDDKNPQYLLSVIDTDLIVQIVNGTIDVVALAKEELAGRGFDDKGKDIYKR